MEPAVLPQQQGRLVSAREGCKVHVCCKCELPIAVYGRIAPCLHAFCLACATSTSECFVCGAAVQQVEKIQQGACDMFISAATLQSFKSAIPSFTACTLDINSSKDQHTRANCHVFEFVHALQVRRSAGQTRKRCGPNFPMPRL